MSPAVRERAGAARLARGLLTSSLPAHARQYALQYGTLAVFLLIWLVFIIGAPRTFLSFTIYASFMSTVPFFAVMALPLTLVIISGEIDLSFPSIMALSGLAFVETFGRTGNLVLALFASLAAGLIAGLLNGLIVVRLGIPSLVATIGTLFFWRGFVLVVAGGMGASLVAAKGTLLYSALVGRVAGKIPAQMIWTLLIAVGLWFLLNRHRLGAHIYLVGDSAESARMMGVDADRVRMATFTLLGGAAAIASVLASLEVAYYWATLGEGYLLRTLSAVFLGGTSVFGGTGTILGTFLGSLMIGAIEAGIVAMGMTGFWTQLIYGLIIIVSVTLQTVLGRRLAR